MWMYGLGLPFLSTINIVNLVNLINLGLKKFVIKDC
jgi:hypothetical protein